MKYLVIVLGIIILLLLGVIIYKNYQYNKLQVQTTEKPVFRNLPQKSDKNGNKYVEIPEQLYTQAQINKITDSVRKIYGKSKIVGQVQTITKIIDTSKDIFIYIDTGKHTIFAKDSSRFINQSFTGNSSTNLGHFTLSLTLDTLTYIEVIKTHWFKSNEHSVILNHTNELYQTITGNAIALKEKKVEFCFGPSIGYTYSLFSHQFEPTIGLSLTYNIFPIYRK